jgi:hypothetical protein
MSYFTEKNRWSLYDTVEGYEAVAAALDIATANAIVAMDAAIADGVSPKEAVVAAFNAVRQVMEEEQNAACGAADGDSNVRLARLLTKNLRQVHNLPDARISSYGEIEGMDRPYRW